MRSKLTAFWMVMGWMLPLLLSPLARAGEVTVAGTATVAGVSSRWFAVQAPLSGDDNRNGYTVFELGPTSSGPFTTSASIWGNLPGSSAWRIDTLARNVVAPGMAYFVRVTYVDPDGVTGANPQILGPVTTLAAASNAVTAGTASAEARDEEIFVTVPISGDADLDSFGTVDVAPSASGPWTRKCGSTFDRNLFGPPKRCRLRSLTPGTDYWVRVTLLDDDGVVGTNPQILGPIRYQGLENLALGRPISAEPGWGCCPSPSHLVDGRVQNDAWFFGFAWTGGNSHWAGGPAGFKQATVDLGSPTRFDRAVMWYHDSASVPTVWKIQVSHNGATWTDVASFDEPICRGAGLELGVSWSLPSCAHGATFSPVTARFLRFTFDDRTLFRGLHGWAVELEVFDTGLATGLVVTNTHDSGPGSLRQAILDANASPGTISFHIPTNDPGFDGDVFTIQPLTPLPEMRNGVTLDGTTQTTFSGDSNPLGPEVVLDGRLLASGSGILISGDGNTVQGLVIQGFPGAGVAFSRLPFDPTPSRNRALGNYIGTDATGTVAVPNGAGMSIGGFGSPFAQARDNVVEGNLISGNRDVGISMCDAADTRIAGNRIGTDRSGAEPLGNGSHGISLVCAGDPRTSIEGNTIAYNGGDGVRDSPDYRFGVAFTPDGHQGNAVRANSIHGNGGLAINLLPPPFPPTEPASTPTPNDSCDQDGGGNLLQNFPEITRVEVVGGSTVVEGFLDSTPGRSFTVELFANAEADPSGFGEAEQLLTTLPVTPGADCLGEFQVVVPVALVAGQSVTATATDEAGNTSELSFAFEVVTNRPPVADAGPDQTVAAGDDCLAAVTLDGSGSSDPDGDSLTWTWSGPFGTAEGATAVVALPPGSHTVTLTVDDGQGGGASDELQVTVEDRTPPLLSGLPESEVVECAGPGGTPVALPLPSAVDNCDGPVAVASDAPDRFPLGSTTVTFTTADAAGNQASASVTVTVRDTTPPELLSLAVSPDLLWPPDHRMVAVTLAVEAAELCEATPPVCRVSGVASNEPTDGTGDGDTAPDWWITGELTVDLRAERAGGGHGRLYTVEVSCADGAGNTAAGTVGVVVPHDRGKGRR